MMMPTTLRALPEKNTNYTPPVAWRCATFAEHVCAGPVVGAMGAVPVCANGAWAEEADRLANEARIARLMADPSFREQLRREAAEEAAFERRCS
jgi:hypothetical protein